MATRRETDDGEMNRDSSAPDLVTLRESIHRTAYVQCFLGNIYADTAKEDNTPVIKDAKSRH